MCRVQRFLMNQTQKLWKHFFTLPSQLLSPSSLKFSRLLRSFSEIDQASLGEQNSLTRSPSTPSSAQSFWKKALQSLDKKALRINLKEQPYMFFLQSFFFFSIFLVFQGQLSFYVSELFLFFKFEAIFGLLGIFGIFGFTSFFSFFSFPACLVLACFFPFNYDETIGKISGVTCEKAAGSTCMLEGVPKVSLWPTSSELKLSQIEGESQITLPSEEASFPVSALATAKSLPFVAA